MISATYWQRINANGWAPNNINSCKKKQWLHNEYYETLLWDYPVLITNFSLCWPLILLHHVSSTSSHIFPISAGFQLTLFPRVGRAGFLTPLCPQTGSRKFWIQATACLFVRHITVHGITECRMMERKMTEHRKCINIEWPNIENNEYRIVLKSVLCNFLEILCNVSNILYSLYQNMF